jgi:hypothetical protein
MGLRYIPGIVERTVKTIHFKLAPDVAARDLVYAFEGRLPPEPFPGLFQ